MMNFASLVLIVLFATIQQALVVDAFVTPRSSVLAHHVKHVMPSSPFCVSAQRLKSECRAVSPLQAYQHVSSVAVIPSFLPSFLTAEDIAIPDDIQLEKVPSAFDVNDPILRNIVVVFGAVILALVAVNAILSKMDSAIENVLVDFEKAMRAFYPSRWYELEKEAGLKDLDKIERSVKLIAIMDRLEKDESEFMAKLNQKMVQKS
jgi:hypothetical protein